MFLSSQHKWALTEACNYLIRCTSDTTKGFNWVFTSRNPSGEKWKFDKTVSFAGTLMAIIFLYHIHFTEVLQLPVFMPQNDSKQKFYRDPSSWNRKRQGIVNICSTREEDGEGKMTFYFLYYHHNCFFISCSLLKLNTAEHQIHSTGNKWKNCRWLLFFSTFWICTGIRMHVY